MCEFVRPQRGPGDPPSPSRPVSGWRRHWKKKTLVFTPLFCREGKERGGEVWEPPGLHEAKCPAWSLPPSDAHPCPPRGAPGARPLPRAEAASQGHSLTLPLPCLALPPEWRRKERPGLTMADGESVDSYDAGRDASRWPGPAPRQWKAGGPIDPSPGIAWHRLDVVTAPSFHWPGRGGRPLRCPIQRFSHAKKASRRGAEAGRRERVDRATSGRIGMCTGTSGQGSIRHRFR